jgi:hypothetical protein
MEVGVRSKKKIPWEGREPFGPQHMLLLGGRQKSLGLVWHLNHELHHNFLFNIQVNKSSMFVFFKICSIWEILRLKKESKCEGTEN